MTNGKNEEEKNLKGSFSPKTSWCSAFYRNVSPTRRDVCVTARMSLNNKSFLLVNFMVHILPPIARKSQRIWNVGAQKVRFRVLKKKKTSLNQKPRKYIYLLQKLFSGTKKKKKTIKTFAHKRKRNIHNCT